MLAVEYFHPQVFIGVGIDQLHVDPYLFTAGRNAALRYRGHFQFRVFSMRPIKPQQRMFQAQMRNPVADLRRNCSVDSDAYLTLIHADDRGSL